LYWEKSNNFALSSLRGRIQHRADQDPVALLDYWSNITGVEKAKFYPCYLDKRTIGKATTKLNYRGVCTIMSAGTHIQLELKEIADIISNAVVQ
jgi:hypothetical protein